jgi:hypothetical protein
MNFEVGNRRAAGRAPIIVVSGLPRSGTSLMMQMLAAAAIEIVSDDHRSADEDNPGGYFEFDRVKKLAEGDVGWLSEAQGKAVKVVSPLLELLPPTFEYRVVFMERRIREILASQRRMLANRGEQPRVRDAALAESYRRHLATVKEWLRRQPHFHVLDVDYNRLIVAPEQDVDRLSSFLDRPLALDRVKAVIDVKLYRAR